MGRFGPRWGVILALVLCSPDTLAARSPPMRSIVLVAICEAIVKRQENKLQRPPRPCWQGLDGAHGLGHMRTMLQDEEWRFDAWRLCPQCGGTGEEPPWIPGHPVDSTVSKCSKCGDGPRPRYETRTFTLVQLAAELKSLTF